MSWWKRLRLTIRGSMQQAQFDAVSTYCMFIGQPRSGHSVVGSLLNAHKNAVISNGLDALDCVRAGWRRNTIYRRILDHDAIFTRAGSIGQGYDYKVPDEWQGRFESLQVIGDKRGGAASRHFAEDPDLLSRLRDTVGVPLRMVHVVRNPYDNISTIARREEQTLEQATEFYFAMCRGTTQALSALSEQESYSLRHEEMIAHPATTLTGLCRFLELPLYRGYIEHCASIVWQSPSRPRDKANWSKDLIDLVAKRMEPYRHLDGYDFNH